MEEESPNYEPADDKCVFLLNVLLDLEYLMFSTILDHSVCGVDRRNFSMFNVLATFISIFSVFGRRAAAAPCLHSAASCPCLNRIAPRKHKCCWPDTGRKKRSTQKTPREIFFALIASGKHPQDKKHWP